MYRYETRCASFALISGRHNKKERHINDAPKVLKNYVTSDLMNSYGMDKLREKYASQIEFMNDKAAKQFIKEALWKEQYNKFRENYADEIAGLTEKQAEKYLEQE